ncbi:hypothetical protein E2C01_002378 [Portunus trituberculatus]|uniref:Uncharacterized protein n=1 Tax=Portunus trituberculatus TaxID=210409 RepID=A0A5B7CK83_PORTR|nr:hypothetical protein [Portunus trituberculatus]
MQYHASQNPASNTTQMHMNSVQPEVHSTITCTINIGEKASYPQVLKNIMALVQALWSEDLRELKDTAISTATAVEVALS